MKLTLAMVVVFAATYSLWHGARAADFEVQTSSASLLTEGMKVKEDQLIDLKEGEHIIAVDGRGRQVSCFGPYRGRIESCKHATFPRLECRQSYSRECALKGGGRYPR